MHAEHDPTPQQEPDHDELQTALTRAIAQSPPAAAPRIWAGSIPDYLAGEPHGRWITASRGPKHLAAQVNTMLSRGPRSAAEEAPTWAIFAAEGFGRHEPPPDAGLADIAERAQNAREESRAFAAWASLNEGDLRHCLQFPAAYQGRYDSLADWVTLQVEAAGYDQLLNDRIPDHLRPFVDIDIEALSHDMVAGGDVAAVTDPRTGGVWVFTDPRLTGTNR